MLPYYIGGFMIASFIILIVLAIFIFTYRLLGGR